MFNDMNLFHKVVYKIIPVTMPDYLTLNSGDSRLRSTFLDNLSFVSNIAFVYKIPYRRARVWPIGCIQDTLSSRAALGRVASASRE